MKKLFRRLKFRKGDFGYEIIQDQELFSSVELLDKTLSWLQVKTKIKVSEEEQIEMFFQLDPINAIDHSELDKSQQAELTFGTSIKEVRKYSLNMTQQELGEKIGSDKQYISKIENQKTDPELKTLKKIYEVGLDRKIYVAHYDERDPIGTFDQSIFRYKFLQWASENQSDLRLIEGVGKAASRHLFSNGIDSTQKLAMIPFPEFVSILSETNLLKSSHHPDTWIVQAKLAVAADWYGLIKLQKLLSRNKKSRYSKIEQLARREIKDHLYFL